jgi:superfamily II DNA or RNA helicase
VDEAHNFGATGLQRCLLPIFKYRLALSATLERHHDAEGTQALYNYFGKKCIEFSLRDAIDQGFLTHYLYHPVIVTLNEEELQEYIRLTDIIIKQIRKNGGIENLPKQTEMLLIKRARIVAGAQSKIDALRRVITPYKDENNILVYCGATRVTSDDCEAEDEDQRQIEAVTDMLGNELGMRVSMFTSKEKADERTRLKEGFADGSIYQALIAIKCLDEGVNIPGIRTAFILASSTNPKEYIQRRGRVLRKAKGKEIAEIYDFIVMPHDLTESRNQIVDIDAELSLVKRELERVEDFMSLCDNYSEAFSVKEIISEYYQTNYIQGGTDYGI